LGPNNFIEIYCQCPIEICEQRDQKGIYRRARAGEIKNFTGISSPYEQPESPDLIVESGNQTVDANTARVIALLKRKGIIVAGDSL
jgi:adenylylsulfate kinase